MSPSAMPLVVLLGIGIPTAPVPAEHPAPSIEATIESVRNQTGPAYLAAREHLLSLPPKAVEPKLQAMKQIAADPLEDLVWDALIIRLKDRQADDTVRAAARTTRERPITLTVHLKVEFAIKEALDQAALGDRIVPITGRKEGPPVPDPDIGAGMLIRYLGDDSLPIAAELLCKKITAEWEPWKREMLLHTLTAYIRLPDDPDKELMTTTRDRRSGWLALWMVQHEPDERLVELASRYFYTCPDSELLRATRAARDRTTNDARRALLLKAEKSIEAGMRQLELRRAQLQRETESRSTTQPGA